MKKHSAKRWQPFPPPPPPKEAYEEFVRGYIKGALWSELDDEGQPLDKNYGMEDIAEATLLEMIKDASAFQKENWDDLESNMFKAGLDLWLTRNGHGAGYWDGDYPKEVGDRLTKKAHEYGEYHLYVGDDGFIHGG